MAAMALTVSPRWTSIAPWPGCCHARPARLLRRSSSGASKTWRRAILAGAASAVVTCRRCKGSTLEDMEGFPEIGEMEPIEIEEFEEVEFEMGEKRQKAEMAATELLEKTNIIRPGTGIAEKTPLPCVAVCGMGREDDEKDSVAAMLHRQLRIYKGGSPEEPVWFDLDTVAGRSFEELDQSLALCRTMVVCPPLNLGDRRKIKALRDGLKLLLESVPMAMNRIIVLSTIGAQAGTGGFNVGSFFGVDFKSGSYASLEDEVTAYARKRPPSQPLKVLVVRAGDLAERPGVVEVSLTEVQGRTSLQTAADALFNALLFGVDAGFSVVDTPSGGSRAPWDRLLLPCVGPEVWRQAVPDATQAALFVQQWASTFIDGSFRFGMKTPMEQKPTAAGCELRFRPVGTPTAKMMDELDEGGLEFIAEKTDEGCRLRARRIAYSAKAVIKANSERALLQQFQRDWDEAMGNAGWRIF